MKILKNLAVCLAAIALCGAVTVKSNEPGKAPAKATVRSVTGSATYTVNGMSNPLKVNMELPEGATITTGPNSDVKMSVNGVTSAVDVRAETTISLAEMTKMGRDSQTQLDLKTGSILGQVRKVAANSKYEIKTPRGVAGIRGTDFMVSVSALPGGGFSVTFSSITGTVFVTATLGPNNNVQTVTLHDGQSFTAGENALSTAVVAIAQAEVNALKGLITALEIVVTTIPNVTTATAQVKNPFGGGPPPSQSNPGEPPIGSNGVPGGPH